MSGPPEVTQHRECRERARLHLYRARRNYGDYRIVARIGTGVSSRVFLGERISDRAPCVIKTLRGIRVHQHIQREIKILRNLRDGPNMIQLLDVMRDPVSQNVSLVFECVSNTFFSALVPALTDQDTRFYLFELLRALDYAHSHGVMHRDLKPENVLVDHANRKLKLIDWGLAEVM